MTAITYYKSPVGLLSITADEEAVTSLLFVNAGEEPQVNEANIKITKPKNQLLQTCIKQLDEYFSGKRKIFELPLKQEGTTFQQGVWEQLTYIPYGKTISYLELSKRINNVKAIRAVGSTNGSNKIAIIVPCHRVIGSNGDLTGFGGGLWRKKWLLEHENKYENGVQTLF